MTSMKVFLDNQQYTIRSIERYEKIYGEGSVSTGGVEHAKKMIKVLDLKDGEKVIDVGAGICGQAFYMAGEYKVNVLAIDFSDNMLNIARERLEKQREEIQNLVEIKMCDVTKEDLPENRYDVVHCRDVMMHVFSKKLWIEKMFKSLRPGGRIAVSDYFRGDRENSESFVKYVQSRKYHLVTIKEFAKLFQEVGFVDVTITDGTEEYGKILKNEIEKLENTKEEYIEYFSEEEFQSMMESWKQKLKRNSLGDHQWGFVYARKPV